MVAPSALIEVCKVTVPIETIEVINPIANPCPSKSRYSSLSHVKCFRCGNKKLALFRI